MKSQLEGYFYRYERIRHDENASNALAKLDADLKTASDKATKLENDLVHQTKRGNRLATWSIAATIVTFILATILAIKLAN